MLTHRCGSREWRGAARDHDEFHVGDQAGQPLAGLVKGQDPVRVALMTITGSISRQVGPEAACQVETQA